MNRLRQAGVSGVFGAALSVGLVKPKDTIIESPTTSGQLHDGAEATKDAPPAVIEVPLNRELRRALGVPKGQLAAFVADQSVELTELEESIESHYSSARHQAQSTHRGQFQ